MTHRKRFLCGSSLLTAAILAAAVGQSAPAPKVQTPNAKLDVAGVAQLIDRHIQARLATDKVPASPVSSDAEFLRRVYLDIIGVIPPADKAAAFLDSKDPAKRAKLIDELLANPQFGKHMADIWQGMMLPRDSANRRLQFPPLVKWLEENFNANKPWNEMVHELLTASGSQDKNGAVTYFLANGTPDKINDSVCQLFLGVRLQCAQCHNHPFTTYKQDEYWAMAAFFMKVRPDNINRAAKTGGSPGISEGGTGRPRGLPESAKFVPAKFLEGATPTLSQSEPYRPVLAAWLTANDNPYFARAMVNRTWAQFFGKGIVNPVDDMHGDNPATHPELLKAMAEQFVANGFDLKNLIRCICNSQTYQRTSKPASDILTEKPLFERMAVKPLTPEQLYDSLTAAMGPNSDRGAQRPRPAAGGRGQGGSPRDQFVAFFMLDEGADPTEYQAGIPQALRLMNSAQMNRSASTLQTLTSGKKPAEAIEQLYLATLARRPDAMESQRLLDYVQKNGGDKAYADIFWVLLNTSEFALNH